MVPNISVCDNYISPYFFATCIYLSSAYQTLRRKTNIEEYFPEQYIILHELNPISFFVIKSCHMYISSMKDSRFKVMTDRIRGYIDVINNF
jgi:alpha-L-fucosidase